MSEAAALAFYVLLVSAGPGEPQYQWRIEGGYDSCSLMREMLLRYAPRRVSGECVSGREWHAAGRPGLVPGLSAPWVSEARPGER